MIGIRREDKYAWERRVPLTPGQVQALIRRAGVAVKVQPSEERVFADEEYERAGASISEDLGSCRVVLGVKEMSPACFRDGGSYMFFSHTIKGQRANMPMLQRLLDLRCQLLDYECVTDPRGRRLLFFGRQAGQAGMVDSLWALGQRLAFEGIPSPFAEVRQAFHYGSFQKVEEALARVALSIVLDGVPAALAPLVVGFAGYGNTSRGAQEVLDLLPVRQVAPEDLAALCSRPNPPRDVLFKVVFREEHMVAPKTGDFGLQEYYRHPERYRGTFAPYLEHLVILMNCIYWEERYPRLLTRERAAELFDGDGPPRLRVVGDVSCDLEGAVQLTTRHTDPADPVYVYEAATGRVRPGVEGAGPVVLAVDTLPAELPESSSRHFGRALMRFVPALAAMNTAAGIEESGLPEELARAAVVWRGELTPGYRYLKDHL